MPPPKQDLLLNLVTAQYFEDIGLWVMSIRTLTKRYTRGWFWIDVVRVGVLVDGGSWPFACILPAIVTSPAADASSPHVAPSPDLDSSI